MGFTVRFVLGFFSVLAICSSVRSASTWRRMKLLAQDASILEPIDKNSEIIDTSSSAEVGEILKPKTDETNKIAPEAKFIGDVIDPISIEHKLDRALSVTENNDLSKESLESPRAVDLKPVDLNINIDKYISEEFHDKNNVYKLQTSPDIEKYVNPGNKSDLKTTTATVVDTTSNYDFDKKLQAIQNDIKKNLEYIDEKFPKSTFQYEEAIDNETLGQFKTTKYINATSIEKGGNNLHKDEQVESGQKLDYGSSYIHTVADEQKHVSSSEMFFDNNPKVNESDGLKNKIYRAKTTVDPEVLHGKLNQTERHSALLSNKIEHDSTNDIHRSKWSIHYTPTAVPYTTTTGQKEEIMFVPYTKENPINISKRGSTKFINTITTPKSIQPKQIKGLDEAALENHIYPVQVLAPNRISKEEMEETNETNGNFITPVLSTTPNTSYEVTTVPNVVDTVNENVTTINGDVSSIDKSATATTANASTKGLTTVTEDVTSNIVNPETTSVSEVTALVMTEKGAEDNSTLNSTFIPEKDEELTGSTLGKFSTENSTISILAVTEDYNITTSGPAVKFVEENSTLGNSATTLVPTTKENSTIINTLPVETTVRGEISTTGDYVSDQATLPVVANETTMKNTTPTTQKSIEVTQTDSTIGSDATTLLPEITTLLPDTTLDTSSFLPVSTMSALQTEKKSSITYENDTENTTPFKIESRKTSARDLKNLTTASEPSTIVIVTAKQPIETTTVNYNDNIINQSNIVISTTDHFSKHVPENTVHSQRPPIERKPYSAHPTSSESNDNEGAAGNGYSRSEEQDEGSNGGKIAAIVISCIGAVCFVIVAILLFVMRKRHKRFNYGQRCTPVSLDAYSVDNVSAYNSVRRKGMLRASKRSYGNPAFEEASVTHLLNFPELMKFGFNKEEVSLEYDDIPQISVQMNELPEGCETKNRYANVIPLPESRVFLSTLDECFNSDYINANFVTGNKSFKNYYIACQAPMQNTVDDFWRMIWEQQSRVILMLTHLFENGAEKCFDYLPPSEVLDCHRLFGDFQITLKKREVKEKYVISILQLKNMVSNTWREVTHLWYLGWPERGVPAEESSLVAFLIEARSYVKVAPSENGKMKDSAMQESNGIQEYNQIVVHCSPGTGRTGTVIACDIAIREFELTRQVDIPKSVYQIRRNRAGAVQSKEQYAFIYRVITWYANKLTGSALDSF